MSRRVLRTLGGTLPLLGLTFVARDGAAEGIDRFAWPLTGSRSTGAGFDHDRMDCPSIMKDGQKVCDPEVDRSEYIRDKDCGSSGAYDQHTGTDTYAPEDDLTIYAAASGVVISSTDGFGRGALGNTDGHGFGNSVVIYHGGGLASLYGHMEQDSGLPAVGQWVECGDAIGEQGSSGNSTGDHLHFDVRTGVEVSNSQLGGYLFGTHADPFLSSKDDDDQWCGASTSMWVEHTGDLPSRTCDEDAYVGAACSSDTLGQEVDDGACVQNGTCAWYRCVDGAWLAVGDGAAEVCETINHANDSCEAIECGAFESPEACDVWEGSCGWSCEQDACVSAEEAEGEGECTTEPPPACDDGLHNGEETGLDCGGPECLGCDGDPCDAPSQCASGACGDEGTCEPPAFDCHVFDDDPASCGNATGCVYHECASSCSPNTETACAAGCEDQCGIVGCVTGSATYYNSNNCISGTASGIAELYHFIDDTPVLEGMVGINGDGSFCVDLQVGELYSLSQFDLPGFDCFDDYYVHCSMTLTVGEAGVDGVCADQSSCEDLGAIAFDCGS